MFERHPPLGRKAQLVAAEMFLDDDYTEEELVKGLKRRLMDELRHDPYKIPRMLAMLHRQYPQYLQNEPRPEFLKERDRLQQYPELMEAKKTTEKKLHVVLPREIPALVWPDDQKRYMAQCRVIFGHLQLWFTDSAVLYKDTIAKRVGDTVEVQYDADSNLATVLRFNPSLIA